LQLWSSFGISLVEMKWSAKIVLLAQDTARYNRGLSFFQWGLTGMGVSVIMVGVAL
jgi:ATP/ADP translocase